MERLLPIAAACFLAVPFIPQPTQAARLPICGARGVATDAPCFIDANGDGTYDPTQESVCFRGVIIRGGIGCRP